MFALKTYQQTALNVLREYLEQAALRGPGEAFARVTAKHPSDTRPPVYRERWNLDAVPHVCLRLPTGGGKTLLAAHSVGVAAGAFLHRDHPFVLWLVPTNTIRKQTVQALRRPDHPCRQALNAAFGLQGVAIFDIEDLNAIRPSDIFDKTCLVVATMQTFRVEDSNKDARKIYGHNENLEQHFLRLPNTAPGLDRGEDGRPLYSFVNMAHQLRPLVVADEAHKMISRLSGEVMRRINPACIIEFTATPVESNVLFRVFPSQLKAEEMVKLPFNVAEHPSWEEAVLRAVETRASLAVSAAEDTDYIRPLVLFQAEKKHQLCTVERLKQFLLDQDIPGEEIAVATGEQRELDNLDISSPDCPVKYVITVEALKEGWDCPFAYVFCSVANIRSAIDVEQLLGRVMRMPYARARRDPKLNMAYAHVLARTFSEAASAMYDRMLNMGFDEDEAASQIRRLPLPGMEDEDGGEGFRRTPLGQWADGGQRDTPPLIIPLTKKPHLAPLAEAGRDIEIRETATGFELVSKGMLSREAEDAILPCVPQARREDTRRDIARHRHAVAMNRPPSPARQGIPFAVPLLLMEVDGELEVAEPELLAADWSPLDLLRDGECPLDRGEFRFDSQEHVFQFDLEGEKMVWRPLATQEQLSLYQPPEEPDVPMLSRKLDRLCTMPDISQPVMLEFCRRCVRGLVERDGMEPALLYRARDVLAQCIRDKIARLREQARKRGFQQLLLSPAAHVEVSFDEGFAFPRENYAESLPPYAGPYQFARHYYGRPRDLKASGEEFRCAQAIDLHPAVTMWVRNVDRQTGSFWLPTSSDRFYPDFVALLTDGRLLVVEYKGKHLLSSDDTEEKRAIGQLWAEKSRGRGIFLLVSEGSPELGFERQLAARLSSPPQR